MKYVFVAALSFFLTLGLLLVKRKEGIYCYPYLKSVSELYKNYVKRLATKPDPNLVKEFDFQLKALNVKLKTSKKLLLDCSYCSGCERYTLP